MNSLLHKVERACDHDFTLSLEPYEVNRHFLKANSTCLKRSVKSGSLGLARWLMKVFVTESEDLAGIDPCLEKSKKKERKGTIKERKY